MERVAAADGGEGGGVVGWGWGMESEACGVSKLSGYR